MARWTIADDSQNRVGSKFGGGGVAGASETNVDRRERLRKLALETIDLAKVSYPYPNFVVDILRRVFEGSLYPS
ncbi:CWF complex protein sap62 [Termitomyces sp. T32_za158]|nr:CWF complex protein sap62 [Termitomyces sp. T32_za158]